MVELRYRFECFASACDAEEETRHPVYLNDPLPEPAPPPGWTEILGEYICPDHALHLKVDDHEIDLRPGAL